jgi:hypothetical protein
MQYRTFLVINLMLPVMAFAQTSSSASDRTFTASLQAGFTSTFQMALGGVFGAGPDVQDKVTLGVNHLWRAGDSLSAFAWSTADLPSAGPNWQAGLMYKMRALHKPNHTLVLGAGMQRWILPMVKTGAQDWIAAGNLNYATTVKRVPVVVNVDSWSLLRSTLPKGSMLYTQIYMQQRLLRHGDLQVLLREGPQHSYSWGFYGAEGNRIVRYGGCLVLTWRNTSLEAGYRQQFGLQDGIRNNRYWSFLLTRQTTKPFHSSSQAE